MNEIKYIKLIQDCEQQIRSGQASAVSQKLRKIKTADLPRSCISPLANLARRVGDNNLGLRLLSSVVHQDKSHFEAPSATIAELAEYAVLLHRSGALDEAFDILESLDDRQLPVVLLYRSFCHFNEFDSERATKVLQKYIQQETSEYMNLVGRVNLAASYVLGYENEKALEQLNKNIELVRAGGHQRLAGNCLELRAQVYLRERDFSKAQEDLNSAAALIKEFQSLDFLWLQKWQALLDDLRSGHVNQLLHFRESAIKLSSWENVRSADRFRLGVSFDQECFDHVVFGTPYPHFRDLIFRETGKRLISQFFTLGDPTAPGLDLLSGSMDGKMILPPGKQAHRLLAVLASDFYRPFQVGEIFNKLFENEHFDIFTSPNRVHQLVRRTRELLQKKKIPIRLIHLKGAYKMEISTDGSLRVPAVIESKESIQLKWKLYVDLFAGKKPVSSLEARTQLGMSRTTFQRLINWALENGLVEKSGDHKSTLYRLISY